MINRVLVIIFGKGMDISGDNPLKTEYRYRTSKFI